MISAQMIDALEPSRRQGIQWSEGVSEPKNSEAEALLDARNSALRNLAASICSFITGRYDIQQASNGKNPADVVVTIIGNATVTVRLPLTGVQEREQKIERTENNKYIARVVISINSEDLKKAQNYAQEEMAAVRTYNYFARKLNFAAVVLTDVPEGYTDYTSWMETNCLIFEMKGDGGAYLDQVDTFLRKLFPSVYIYTEKIAEIPVILVYNLPDRSEEIMTVLQKNDIQVSRENSRLILTANISPDDFKSRVQNLPDARELIVTGISNHDNRRTSLSPVTLNEAGRLARQNYGITTKVLVLADQYLHGDYNDTELFNRINNNTARYIILITSVSVLEPAIAAYKIPAHYRVSYRCILYDSLTEKIIYGKTVHDLGFSQVSASGSGALTTGDLAEILNSVLVDL
jgi:hypothetical protein